MKDKLLRPEIPPTIPMIGFELEGFIKLSLTPDEEKL